jgi:hypothetical protein
MLVVSSSPDGPAKRVGPNGALIGRQRDCDIVALDPSVSRRHALVRLTDGGAEVVPLGRAPIEVNGKPHARVVELADGDRISLPGLSLSVQISVQRPEARVSTWSLERARGGSFGIVHNPFVAGGDDGDDLIVKKWPPHALVFHVAQGELFVEVASGKAMKNGVEIAPGALEPLVANDELGYRKETFAVRQADTHDRTTMIGGASFTPTRVTIEILPRGGRIVFGMPDGDHSVFLHERRFDLMVALLKPPDAYKAGDLIPDDVVASIVWPRNPNMSRTEINVLIARCRKDLLEAGLAGPRLVQRAPGGGATRFVLADNAQITVSA